MNPPPILRPILMASTLLTLTAIFVQAGTAPAADGGEGIGGGGRGGGGGGGGRPPVPLPATTQGRLESAKSNLLLALKAISDVDPAPYGGNVEKEIADAGQALTDVAQALAYVKEHPEINPLPVILVPPYNPPGYGGSAGFGSPPVPPRPQPVNISVDTPAVTLATGDISGLNTPGMTLSIRNPSLKLAEVIGDLNAALTPMVNRSINTRGRIGASTTFNGPIGDIGGFRAKIIADIVQVDSDAVADYAEGRGPVEPTTQAHLVAVQRALHSATLILTACTGPALLPSPGFGPDLPPAIDALVQKLAKAQADVTGALAYVKSHPEINPLPSGSAPEEASPARPVAIAVSRAPNSARLTLTARAMNAALSHLLNGFSGDNYGLVLGDIGGYRKKIIDDVSQVTADILTQLAAPAPASPGQQGGPPQGFGVGLAPAAMPASKATGDFAAAP